MAITVPSLLPSQSTGCHCVAITKFAMPSLQSPSHRLVILIVIVMPLMRHHIVATVVGNASPFPLHCRCCCWCHYYCIIVVTSSLSPLFHCHCIAIVLRTLQPAAMLQVEKQIFCLNLSAWLVRQHKRLKAEQIQLMMHGTRSTIRVTPTLVPVPGSRWIWMRYDRSKKRGHIFLASGYLIKRCQHSWFEKPIVKHST